jgi:crotonobetainyl-CoA:carnitine CoA-transferase CaiB-like acyl-CoA transferase
MTPPPNPGALRDIRVVELGQLIAGPFCGQLLGDMGADVIKVEQPGSGDPMREWGRGDAKLWWEVVARNKRTVSADMRKPEGQALVRRLILAADILIENFRPGTLEKWNLAPAGLLQEKPGLIVVRVSGYGQDGPYAARPGYGSIGEAMGGLRHVIGEADRPPSRAGISIGDTLAATYGCMGAIAALHHRERTGEGQIVDSAIYEAVLQVMESLVPEYEVSGIVRERSGAVLPGVAPSNVYPCRDGDLLIAANQDGVFARLCAAMERPDLPADPRFASHDARGRNMAVLDAIIAEWTATRAVAEVEALMIDHAVPAGNVFRAPEMLADPHYRAREALVPVDHPRWGRFHMQNSFPKMSATPGSIRRPASARVGQDNAEVYGELLGLSAGDLADLAARGVI